MENLADRVRRLEPQRICIIKPSSLGDVVHCLPILPALRVLFPSSQISWVVNAAFRSLLDSHPDLDRVIAFERGKSGISSRGASATVRLCAAAPEGEFRPDDRFARALAFRFDDCRDACEGSRRHGRRT